MKANEVKTKDVERVINAINKISTKFSCEYRIYVNEEQRVYNLSMYRLCMDMFPRLPDERVFLHEYYDMNELYKAAVQIAAWEGITKF